jgi:adenylosuccinate lyase
MRELWEDSCKFSIWLEIEILACEAMARLGLIPEADAKVMRARGKFSVSEIGEIEKRTNHDVIAFLENVASHIGPEARWVHQGLTSSDVLDTSLAVQLVRSSDILLEDVTELREAVSQKARQYKETPMIGRSHGIHAEPITF